MAPEQRLFFALWPPPEVRAALHAAGEKLGPVGRRIPAENLHLTLVFLGTVPAERLADLYAAAAQIHAAAFDFRLDRYGHFPRAGVVWFGPERVAPALLQLVDSLRMALHERGFGVDHETYRPHVSLFRKAALKAVAPVATPVDWNVERFVLVQSQPDKICSNSKYTLLKEWPLYEFR